MKNKIIAIIEVALKEMGFNQPIQVMLTKPKGHGDYASNIAMQLAQHMALDPIAIALQIKAHMHSNLISSVEVAGPGFINIVINKDVWSKQVLKAIVARIIHQGSNFGKGQLHSYINIEYVSANPTGYLHLGHARGAAIGSALVKILKFAGHKVDSEYYINDFGKQIDLLGISTFVRYQQALGNNKIKLPEDSYKGEDVKACAKFLIHKFGTQYQDAQYEEVAAVFLNAAKDYMLAHIKNHLVAYNVNIDQYSAESSIYEGDIITNTLAKIKDHTYQKDGALWINTTAQGDDKDRVLVKSDKSLTYFMPDLAYHNIKLERGYDELINIWGSDHIGYIKRMQVGLQYLGLEPSKLDILVVQTVKLFKDGQEFKMSKRKGQVVTLKHIIEEVGVDVARWFMLDRSVNSQFVFDITEVVKKTSDNQLFTVQYTHARINQLVAKSSIKVQAQQYLASKEMAIIKFLNTFPEIITSIASNHKVHFLTKYLVDLCAMFNSWYSTTKAIGHAREGSLMALALATKIVIKNGLHLLGISAPNHM